MKPLAQAGLSMIPGVGGLLGAAVGALGSGGKQGGVSGTQNSSTTSNINQLNEAIEPDYFSSFRKGMIDPFMSELDRAMNKPIYGDAQKAAYLQDTQDAAGGSMEGLKAAMARSGRLDSGAFDDAAGNIAMKQYGDYAGFLSQLPFMEEQARTAKVQPLLQLGAQWSGQAPVSQRMTGTNTSNTTGQMSQTQEGPGFWRSFASGIGGQMGWNGQNGQGGWGNWGKPTGTNTMYKSDGTW